MSLATIVLLLSAPAAEETGKPLETVAVRQAAPQLHEHPTLLDMLRRNNELRKGMGMRPQRINPVLTRVAQNHAAYMSRTGSFSHYSNYGPFGRARRFGFLGNVRENIAMGHRNVLTAFTGWRNSGGHWASIISDAPEVGFGYALSKGGTPYWVAVYGYPTAADKQAATKLLEHRTPVASTPAAAPQPAKPQPAKPQPQVAKTKLVQNTQPTTTYYPSRRRGLFRIFRR
jgi:hypothetical protein